MPIFLYLEVVDRKGISNGFKHLFLQIRKTFFLYLFKFSNSKRISSKKTNQSKETNKSNQFWNFITQRRDSYMMCVFSVMFFVIWNCLVLYINTKVARLYVCMPFCRSVRHALRCWESRHGCQKNRNLVATDYFLIKDSRKKINKLWLRFIF